MCWSPAAHESIENIQAEVIRFGLPGGVLMSTGLIPYPRISTPIENVVFKQKNMVLDGYKFKNCAFISCVLHISVGNFVLEECFVNSDTTFIFGENALRVSKVCSLLNYAASPGLHPTIHADGSVTIA